MAEEKTPYEVKKAEVDENFWYLGDDSDDISSVSSALIKTDENTRSEYDFKLLLQELEEHKEELDAIEIMRAKAYNRVSKLSWDLQRLDKTLPDGLESEIKKMGQTEIEVIQPDMIKLTLNYRIPYYDKTLKNKMRYYKLAKYFYGSEIVSRLREQEDNIKKFTSDEKTVILIKSFYKYNELADLDNRFHSFIINAIRHSLIIEDDSWREIDIIESGEISKTGKEYGEVWITRKSNLNKIY